MIKSKANHFEDPELEQFIRRPEGAQIYERPALAMLKQAIGRA